MKNIQNYVKAHDLMLKDILFLSPRISMNVQREYYSHDLPDT